MEKLEAIREGKEKVIHRCDDPNFLICYFKDTITTLFGGKKAEIANKSTYCSQISAKIFDLLEDKGIQTHFIKMMDERSMLIKPLQMIPIELVIRLVVAGSMAKSMGIDEGTKLKKPVIDLYFKSEKLKDPRINESYIDALDIIPVEVLDTMKKIAWHVCGVLTEFLDSRDLQLIDFKLEFGYDRNGKVVLADEISPDTCRIWDKESGEKLDKDRFRDDMGGIEEAYKKVWERVVK